MRRTTQTIPKKRKLTSKTKSKGAQAPSRLGSMYDKMIKENLEKSLKTIIQSVDNFKIIKFEPLRTKIQHTKERDPDELSRIWLADGSEQILHAEVHLKDEDEINYRIGDYHIMLKRKNKKLTIKQYVIFIGSETPKHITGFWQTESMTLTYHLICLKDIPYHTFLNANNPETVVFSILANLEGEDPEMISLQITDRLNKLVKTHAEKEKYYEQLRILSNVRKLQPIIDKIMANIFKLIDISEDPLYVKGILEGKTKGIESLIITTEFDDAYIAYLMAVPVQLVTEARERILKEQKKA